MPARKKASKATRKTRKKPLPDAGTIPNTDKRLRDYRFNVQVNRTMNAAGLGPTKEEQQEFEESVCYEGVQTPIVLWQKPDGTLFVVAGRRRRAATSKARKKLGKAFQFNDLPYILKYFESDLDAQAFVIKDNVRSLSQSWQVTKADLLALLFPPTKKSLMYRNLKSNYAYEDLKIHPDKATPAQRERARKKRDTQRMEQQALRMTAARLLNTSLDNLRKNANTIQRRIAQRSEPKKRRGRIKLEGPARVEGYVLARQREDALQGAPAETRELEALAFRIKQRDSLVSAIDRRLKTLGDGADPEKVADAALAGKPPAIPKTKEKKLRIKQPVVNRRKKTKSKKEPKTDLLDVLMGE